MLLRYALALVAFALLMCFSLVAAGVDPASQPATQPASSSFWSAVVAWLAANWQWLLLVVVIPSIINGLKKKTWREGLIGFFAGLLDRFSATTNKDSPGTLKMPGTVSKPPRK